MRLASLASLSLSFLLIHCGDDTGSSAGDPIAGSGGAGTAGSQAAGTSANPPGGAAGDGTGGRAGSTLAGQDGEAGGGGGEAPSAGTGGSEQAGEAGSGDAAGGGGESSGGCVQHLNCPEETPFCNPGTGQCASPPEGGAIGWGDGSAESVTLVAVYEPSFKREATDLAFHPTRPGELWVLHREFEDDAPCTEKVAEGCDALEGSVSIITAVGTPEQAAKWRKDPNAWHFMRRPPALAFGANETFATCGEFRTGNFTDDKADYIGPTLWSSDPSKFAKQPPGKNGSHLDMIHTSPFGVGIAHERDNVFWIFNGKAGSLDRVDFKEDHGPGNEDHSDGEVQRYGQGEFLRVAGSPGHLIFEESSGTVLVADTGHQRVARLDPSTATTGASFPVYEPISLHKKMNGASITDVVPPGVLEAPSGLEQRDSVIYVSDAVTSRIHAFQADGTPLRSLDTGLPPGSLAGLALSPEGALFFVEVPTSKVFRIDPKK